MCVLTKFAVGLQSKMKGKIVNWQETAVLSVLVK